jgi:glycosyltransferase involved in cell wall biosynthesis
LVLPAVERLAALGARITVMTFDKPADLARRAEARQVREHLRAHGVDWIPLRYHKDPKVPATAFDNMHAVARGAVESLRLRPDVIHTRTFIVGPAGLLLSRLTRARLIYHNEGFYPDEQVDAGVWAEGSAPHRFAKRLEERFYGRADAIFSLSERGKEVIEALPAVREKTTPVIVVPSSVDLAHFAAWDRGARPSGSLRLVYMGSVGGRYLVDRIGRFAHVARGESADARLELLTPAEPDFVRSTIASSGLPDDAWSSRFVPYDQLPGELARYDAGFCFHTNELSAAGGSSTKVGQYWAMGLPVIATPGLGDVDEIVRRERVGVVVQDHTDDAYRDALGDLENLLRDPELAGRCRAAAETHYGLDAACRRQVAVYEQLADAGGR